MSKLEALETSVCELNEMDDEPLLGADGKPVTVTLYGPGSKKYLEASRRNTNVTLKKMSRKGKFESTAEENERNQLELMIACTKETSDNFAGCFHDITDGLTGEDAIRAVYSKPELRYILERVSDHQKNWANFKPKSMTS
ncbi:MAG: hypothetical protein ACTS6J_02085 [Burkholderiales bacterium]